MNFDSPLKGRRVAFVVNHGAFFVSHRLPIARSIISQGGHVKLFIGRPGSASMEKAAIAELNASNVDHCRVIFNSAGINPLIEFFGLVQLAFKLRRYKPDIVHCASPKGVLYGGIAAKLSGAKGVVLAISGMGYAYTSIDKDWGLRNIIRVIYGTMARIAFSHTNLKVIVQNHDDLQAVVAAGMAQDKQTLVIPGSGVHLEYYVNCKPTEKENIVLFPARMIRDKGALEFVDIAKRINTMNLGWRFVMAGAADYKNPSALRPTEIEAWERAGYIEWLGHVLDMAEVYSRAAIVCLPSYREGMPKSLLESAAAGCAVVTTDVPGCREAVVDGQTGVLVPVCDRDALFAAVLDLINDPVRRVRYGQNGQIRAMRSFSVESVIEKTVSIYLEILEYENA